MEENRTPPVVPQAVPTVTDPRPSGNQDTAASAAGAATLAVGDASFFEELAAFLDRQAEKETDDQRRADLQLALAMLCADALDDAEAAQRYLAGCPGHPLTLPLRLLMLLPQPAPEALARLGAEAAARGPEHPLAAAVLVEAAEAWLLRLGDATAAAEACRRALRLAPSQAAARELLRVCLGLCGAHAELAAELSTAVGGPGQGGAGSGGTALSAATVGGVGQAGPAAASREAAERVHLLRDRLDEARAGAEAARRALDDGPAAASLLIVLLESAPLAEQVGLLERALRLCQAEPALAAERAALAALHAGALEAAGRSDEALPLLRALAAPDVAVVDSRFGRSLLGHRLHRLAAATRSWEAAAEACRLLGDGLVVLAWPRAFLRRAAEIYEVHLADLEQAEQLFAELWRIDPEDQAAGRALLRLRLQRGAHVDACAQLEQAALGSSAGVAPTSVPPPEVALPLLRRAAALAESRLGQPERALRLRSHLGQPALDLLGRLDLCRLYRRQGDRLALAAAYRGLATAADSARTAGLFGNAAALVLLAAGEVAAAETALREVGRSLPRDLVSRAALAAIFRRRGQHRALVEVLGELCTLLGEASSRAAVLCEMSRVLAQRLADHEGAFACLDQALAVTPEDPSLLHALGQLAETKGDLRAAVDLRQRAARVLADHDPLGASMLLIEAGEILKQRLDDPATAQAAFEEALRLDQGSAAALGALSALHRQAGRVPQLCEALRRQLEVVEDRDRRLTLTLEHGQLAAERLNDPQAALRSYRQALALDPTSEAALAGCERICRQEQRFAELAEVLRSLPRTSRTLPSLAEALERLGGWAELAEVRAGLLELADDPREQARQARQLAALHETHLADGAAAACWLERAAQADPGEGETLAALARLYEAQGREAELAEALRRLLDTVPASDGQRRAEILFRLGELWRKPPAQLDRAARALESLLEIVPGHAAALRALAAIYSEQGRDDDLLRTLRRTTVDASDQAARRELLVRIASAQERRGDLEGALATWRDCLALDMANRQSFMSFERLCFKLERWKEVLEVYDALIALVAEKRSRAYRLGDLYARKGQLLLQYLQQPDEAARAYLRWLELEPETDSAVRLLEAIYIQHEQWWDLVRMHELRANLTTDEERKLESLRRAARVVATRLGDHDQTLRLFQRVHELDPTDQEALSALERHFARSGEHEKLISVLGTKLALTAGGDEAVALLLRIAQVCEEGLRDVERTIANYRKVLEIAPSHKPALEALTRIHEATERWPEFLEVTRRLLRLTSERGAKALLYFKCGSVVEARFGRDDEAIRYYEAAIKTSPACLPAVHGLRDIYLRRQDWSRVVQTLELEAKLWQESKERAGVLANIGQIYADHLGDPQRAQSYYEAALQADPDAQLAGRAVFEIAFARGDFERAAALGALLAQRAMRDGEPEARSSFYRKHGVVLARTGDLRAAAESLVVALELKLDNLEALDALCALCRHHPEAYDFAPTLNELEKLYRRRELSAATARVLAARGSLSERELDLDAALTIYRQAIRLAPADDVVATPLVDLLIRLRQFVQAAEVLDRLLAQNPSPEVRRRAQLRLAELSGSELMDPGRAAQVLSELLAADPTSTDLLFRLAQELYLLGRFAEARATCERLLALAGAGGREMVAAELGRYTCYLGLVLEALGDSASAFARYRQALEIDPCCVPAVRGLARHFTETGRQREAVEVIERARATAEGQGRMGRELLALRRCLAQVLLAAGDRQGAAEALREAMALPEAGPDEQVMLAEIYAQEPQEVGLARDLLRQVLAQDIRYSPAYRQLAILYRRQGDTARLAHLLDVLDVLGYAEETERAELRGLRARALLSARRNSLAEAQRRELLLPAAALGRLSEVYVLLREAILPLFPAPPLPADLLPIAAADDLSLRVAVADCLRMFAVDAEVFLGGGVAETAVGVEAPRPMLVLDLSLVRRSDAERRFALGRALEPLRGGVAHIARLPRVDRARLGQFLAQFLLPEALRTPNAQAIGRTLPRKTSRLLEKFANAGPEDPSVWLTALSTAADRAGLLACDSLPAAMHLLAHLAGEDLVVVAEGGATLGAVAGAEEMVRFYLSESYHSLQNSLGRA